MTTPFRYWGSSLPRFLLLTLVASVCHAADGPPQPAQESDFQSIFDGKTLTGWEGDPTYWRAEDGKLVGEVTPETILKRNSFIVWRGGTVGDFELKLEYRVSPTGNSGVNYRSVDLEGLPYSMRGYQADIDGGDRWTGNNYEERGRTFIAFRGQKTVVEPGQRPRVVEVFADPDELQQSVVRKDDWNAYHLIVRGDHHQQYLNGTQMNEAWDHDHKNGTRTGLLGVQVHVGPPMVIEYRNIRLAQFDADEPQTIDAKDFSLSPQEHEALMTFDTMEGLDYMQQQAARLTSPPPTEPIDGKRELKLNSKLHLVRHDLGSPAAEKPKTKDGTPSKDMVLIDGDLTVRIPEPGSQALDLGFEKTYQWMLKWDDARRAYQITGIPM